MKKENVFLLENRKGAKVFDLHAVLRREKIEDFREALDVNMTNFIADKILTPYNSVIVIICAFAMYQLQNGKYKS